MKRTPQIIASLVISCVLIAMTVIIIPGTFFGIPVAHAATETIRPTDARNAEGWTTPQYGYDGNTSTSASYANQNTTPSISFGGGASDEATNSWQAKSQSWSAATLYFTFSKDAGSDDTVSVVICAYSGGTCTTKHTLIASTAGSVSKIERSQVLTAADWGGAGFPNIANLRVRVNGAKNAKPDNATSYMWDIRIAGEYTPSGTLTVDIVDSGGTPVASPSMAMNSTTFSWSSQTVTGTFGTSSQRIRVSNSTGTATWTLSIAASATTAVWDSVGTDYDFNDPTASAGDGGDADSVGGQMTINPTVSTISPQSGCSTTGLTKGSSAAFSEGVTDTITLVTADATAGTGCYWDITGVGISQTIPAEQPAASDYDINMTVSIVAS